MLKIRPDKPLADTLLTLIRTLDAVMKQLAIPYFVIGASARDILVEHVHGLDTARATRDIDFAVAISSWDDYERLKIKLSSTGNAVQLSVAWPGFPATRSTPFCSATVHW
ncbi:hypothetical protein MasN3_04880 [Massilia varians]|uniref:Uncharacterized protein n=2 Tax=Massilia varians TaxID=457921 RepID=A0ABN6T3Y1_9BURK|nr:hypothetical protein MasN3_04880 [Massilia varians]